MLTDHRNGATHAEGGRKDQQERQQEFDDQEPQTRMHTLVERGVNQVVAMDDRKVEQGREGDAHLKSGVDADGIG